MSQEIKTILSQYPDYEATIGIEVHVQLKTKSKIFCSCPNKFGVEPNTNICPVCTGQPGTLPVLNKTVVDFAIMAGLATNSDITRTGEFARKHYMYPDLPKNYQITQDSNPICMNGSIPIELPDGSEKNINLVRMHMEEDAGKNSHTDAGYSLVDLNRAGTPLLEIVSKPDIANAFEAKAYLMRLHSIVRYLDISDANMEEGSFRADINISVKRKDAKELGTRAELKNINSFRFVGQAIEYEIERQIELVKAGQKIKQETRQWDNKNQVSISMRSKEEAQDYRYFTDPDLPVIFVDDAWIEKIRQTMPELPHHKYNRLRKVYELSEYEAETLTQERITADFFETTTKLCQKPKLVSNWMLRDLLGYLKEHKLELAHAKITPRALADLVLELDKGTINSKTAQDIFIEMMQTGKSPLIIIDEKDLKQIGSSDELEKIVLQIIASNSDQVAKYRAGNEKLFMFFVGQAMKETKGKGNPTILAELFKKHLQA
jgi:aspartyl-tRNA(Asn)/glutamyl-tRNA(Gln) amidotransferase subunit B